jgi:membrane-associated phospholipid phosphatase
MVGCLIALTPGARATDDPWTVRYEVDVPVTAALVAGSVALRQIPVDKSRRWRSEILGIDEGVRGTYSSQASSISDATLALTLTAPVFAVGVSGLEPSTGHRGMIYVETLAATGFLTQTAKYVVQRPRPFVYGEDPRLRRKAEEADSRLSFFSGHSSLAFAAAVSGSYLFAAQSEDETARAVFWGVELALATTTAGLRIRAGKHFPSDVFLGAAVGTGLGVAIPRLHLDPPSRYSPTLAEWTGMVGGVTAGLAAAVLLPASQDAREALDGVNVQLAPVPLPGGAGFLVFGTL